MWSYCGFENVWCLVTGEGVCTEDTKDDGEWDNRFESSTGAGCVNTSFFPASARKPPDGGREAVDGLSNNDGCWVGIAVKESVVLGAVNGLAVDTTGAC